MEKETEVIEEKKELKLEDIPGLSEILDAWGNRFADGLAARMGLDKVQNMVPMAMGYDQKLDNGGFKTFGEFLHTIKNNPNDPRLKVEKSGLSEGTDSAGGFTVPDQFSNTILMDAVEASVIRQGNPMVIPMTRESLEIPKIVDSSHASSLFGGVVAYWTEETGTLSVKEPTFGAVRLNAHKLAGYTYASNELLADSAIALEALLVRMFSDAIAWYEDDGFINGNGVGQPLGILNSGALLAINRSAASTVAIADVANVWGRLLTQSHGRAVWFANQTVLPQLLQLGSTYMTWMSNIGGQSALTQTPPAVLLGRPIYFSEKFAALGTAGDIVLADLGYYIIGDRKRIAIDSSIHVRFTTDETAWRFIKRVDGQPWIDSAFTPYKGGSTLSPFVTLYTATTGGD